MEDDQLIILIKKYLDGNSTPEETQIVESWYELQKNEQALFHKGDPEKIRHSSAQSLEKIRTRITAQKEHAQQLQPAGSSLRIYSSWFAAAAVILISLITGLYLYQGFNGKQITRYKEITASTGQVIHITLSDHTSIWLNACSRLKYPQTMNGSKREVYLEGEAYFDVFHDAARPFLVHTPKLTTTVLGTAFSVTAYRNMPVQTVTVARGKVQVASDKKVLGLLTPDKKVDYNNKSGQSYLSDVSATAVTSWKDGKLQFENQNMQDIAARLDRWYGYSFKFANLSTQDCRYTASFNNKIPLTNLLEVMKAISRLNYKIDHTTKTVTFLGTGCNK